MSGRFFRCPSCQVMLHGSAHLKIGAILCCKKCKLIFRYTGEEPDPRPAEAKPKRETAAPRPAETQRSRPSPLLPSEERFQPAQEPRHAPAPYAAPEKPRRPPSYARPERRPRSNAGLIVGLVGGGVGLAVVAVGIIVVISVAGRTDAPPVAAVTQPAGSFHPSNVAPAPQPFTSAPAPAPSPSPPETPDEPAPDDSPSPIAPDTDTPAAVSNPAPVPSGNGGALASDVLDRVKKATVYIRVAKAEGVMMGSGFFEKNSGFVLTNAHVLGMLEAGEPAPNKVDVVLQSGEKNEKTLAGRIISVDRGSDLAVLSVDLKTAGLTTPPASLTVASATGLRETQQVYVFGFPFGEGLGKNITVSTSSVSSLRKDKDGVLAEVQVNGGMNPGNSGGPVVDAGGNVVGVAVAIIKGTQFNFAIPGDAVLTVLRGRCSEIRVGEALRKSGQISVPVDLKTIDPLHGLHDAALQWWIGDPKQEVGPNSKAASAAASRHTTPISYKPETMVGHADLILRSLPASGQVLWVQPTFVDGSGKTLWFAGVPVTVSQPVDAKPALLALRPRVGKTHVNLKSTATVQLRTNDGEKHSLLNNIETRMIEETRGIDVSGLASLYETFEHFEIGRSIDGKGPPASPRFQHIIQDVGKLSLSMVVDRQGNVSQKVRDLSQVPPESRDALDGFGDQVLQSLDIAALPVPGGLAQPGQSWTALRSVPIDTIDSYYTAAAELTYVYRGVRVIDGQECGVVEFNGGVRPVQGRSSNLSGQIHGTAAIDLAAGRVRQAHAVVDVTIDVKFLDESLRSDAKLEVTLDRTAP